ncbi:MAG TPA: GAF domain-containing protein, partial [Candidatus Polarisedimenticolia bacterium]|nr:GAF domain-containing protein [Candidatus Polarisedimenticolia bacterium]
MEHFRRVSEPDLAQRESLRAEQLFLVFDIIKKASTSLDPPTFFRLLVDTIYREIKSFSHVSIFEYDSQRGRIRAMAMAGEGGSDKAFAGSVAPVGALEAAIRTGSASVSNDLMREVRGASPVAPLSRSCLCIPIRTPERLLALLNIESREKGVFAPPEIALFEILCEHLANFLQGVTLYEEVRRKSIKIRRITEICRHVLEAQSLDEALQTAVRAVVAEYGFYCARVALLTPDQRELEHRAHHAQVEFELAIGHRQRIDEGIVGKAVVGRKTVRCDDVTAEPEYVGLVPDVRAELIIPLLAGDSLLGVLDVSARETNAFDDEDISLMETLGGQLALVIDKARYLHETERARDYLENLFASAGDGIMALDLRGTITRWNRGMERILGYEGQEMLGRSYEVLAAPEDLEKAKGVLARAMKGETLEEVADRVRCKDGKTIDVMLTLAPINGPGDGLEGVSVIARDVTDRRRMEENLWAMHTRMIESEAELLEMVERAPDAIFLLESSSGRILSANAMAETFTG